jgi:hypothetical protein
MFDEIYYKYAILLQYNRKNINRFKLKTQIKNKIVRIWKFLDKYENNKILAFYYYKN